MPSSKLIQLTRNQNYKNHIFQNTTNTLSTFSMFYYLYFVAKTIKIAELQKKLEFVNFASEFFLIWFYPIGIWFIQPKINKIIEE